jgi:hypothetical protein
MAEMEKLDIRWNAAKGRFTFKDGSHLPDQVRKLYRRSIWNLKEVNGEAKLIVERTGTKRVGLCLEWSGNKGAEVPASVVKVFAVKDKAMALAQTQMGSAHYVGSDQVLSSRSFAVELAEGEQIQVWLELGNRKEFSPVYTP